jgi:hypothetical protein
MSERSWRRLSARQAGDDEDVLAVGIPPWLSNSLGVWLSHAFSEPTYDYAGYVSGSEASGPKILAAERALRQKLVVGSPSKSLGDMVDRIVEDQEFGLDLLDYAVHTLDSSDRVDVQHAERLLSIFEEGGSAWTVGIAADRRFELQHRVERAGAAAAADARAAGRAGDHISRAWSSAFGRSPNPSYAYAEAIRAVEAAAIPVFTPNDAKATLGTIIAAIRDKPEKWTVHLKTPSVFDSVTAFRSMLELLWKAQHDRHGMPAATSADDITQHEAEAAVHLAVTCVLWLERGVISSI